MTTLEAMLWFVADGRDVMHDVGRRLRRLPSAGDPGSDDEGPVDPLRMID